MIKRVVHCLICFLFLSGRYLEGVSLSLDYEKIEEDFSYGQKKIANILLKNGIQVLLISDPYASESFGAVSIEAGAWDDPKEYQGMAHFVEHLLFLGTETYPDEDDFTKYIRERGGECNASTYRDKTIYGFSIHKEFFEGVLDRFSHFFIDPLFTVSAIQREIHAVDHEFEEGIENDFFRIWRVLKETGNQDHPNRNFSCGNLTSLQNLQREDVVQWFEKHYAPHRIKVVLYSSLSLAQLKKQSSHVFSVIPKREMGEQKKKQIDSSMLSSLQKGAFIYMEPTFNNKILSLRWEVPKYFMQSKKKEALFFVEEIINRSHPNSLNNVLVDEGLAVLLKAEFLEIDKEHGFFNLDITLTQEGLNQHENVISRCFEAIRSFKKMDLSEYLLSYRKSSQSKTFRIQDFKDVMDIASDFLDEPYLRSKEMEDLDIIKETFSFLDSLLPQECVYFLLAPFQESGVFPTYVEKWMGTSYFIRKIKEEKIREWSFIKLNPLIDLISEKEFLKANVDEPFLVARQEPLYVIHTPFVKICLVEPSEETNTLEACFVIDSPSIGGSIKNRAASEIFIHSINALLKKEEKDKEDLRCELKIEGRNLVISFTGLEVHMKESLQKVFFFIKNLPVSSLQFEKAKNNFLDNYHGDPDPIVYAQKILESLLSKTQITEMELYQAVKEFSYDEYKKWQANAFNKGSIEGVFLGKIGSAKAIELWEGISLVFPFIPYKSYEWAGRESAYLEDKTAHCFLQKTDRLGNALVMMVAAEGGDSKSSVAREMMALFLQSEFFLELRTKQQTGYKVFNWTRMVNNTICYGFSIQSSTHYPVDLLKRVEFFLDKLANNLDEKFPLSRFELLKNTLTTHWKKKASQATNQEDRTFADRNIEFLKKLSYECFITSIKETFCMENRKRVAVLIEGRDFSSSDRKELSSIDYEILNE